MNFKRVIMLSAAATMSAAGAAVAETKWDMPLAYPAANFHSVNAGNFAKCVGEGTKGEIVIATHPGGSLFKGNDIKRAVQTGQTQIGERLLSAHENENALFGTDSIPFIASSYDASVKLYAAAKPELEKTLDAQGLVLLYSVPWPGQGLYFKKSVASDGDLKGIKVRSYNAATARISELTGMVPVQIEAAEITQALAAGVIESLITSAVTGQDSKAWEQLSHFYKTDAWLPRNAMIINKGVWDGLDAKTKDAIKACAATAETAGLEMSKAANQAALEVLAKNGMQVLDAPEALQEALKKHGETMAAEWAAKAGDGGKAVLEAYTKK